MRQVSLTPQALKDLKDYDDPTQERVKKALHHLADHPLDGKPLKDHFKKEKVLEWPYRILYPRTGSEWLDVLSIEHRKDVYR